MSIGTAQPTARRLRQLDAMGVTLYRLRPRGQASGTPNATVSVTDMAEPVTAQRLVVVCDEPAATTCSVLAAALGLDAGLLRWCQPEGERLPGLDLDAAYFLVLGTHLARVLGAQLPTLAQQSATIVVTAAPSQWRGDAMAKRLLWQALRPLRRRLGETA